MKKIVFIGAGNLATNLSKEMKRRGFEIIQVFSRTEEAARELGVHLSCPFTTSLAEVTREADMYVFSVKDAVLENVLQQMPATTGIWVHTAGSIPMDIFSSYTPRYGVFYPLQTFSKTRDTDFSVIPFFIEANNQTDRDKLINAAGQL
ncbi:MAG: NAD(P)-binding domain-containing protein, partial [Bacteroidales bacterium]